MKMYMVFVDGETTRDTARSVPGTNPRDAATTFIREHAEPLDRYALVVVMGGDDEDLAPPYNGYRIFTPSQILSPVN